jgi:histidinol-phosphate aminotransferase
MSAIKPSRRLSRVKRVFDPYQDRTHYVRLDRNEDPVGWDDEHFERLRRSLSQYDLAAYADSSTFVRKLAAWLQVPPEWLLVTAGSDAAIKTLFETYVDPDDVVLMQDPNWRMYEVYNNVYQGRAVFVPYDRNLHFPVPAVSAALREHKVRLLILANPNQPTGTLLEAAVVEEIVAAAAQTGTVVAMDEAYYLFTPQTALGLVQRYPNLIIARTFSKAFGLAGLRLGYCVAQPERIAELSLLRPVTDSNSIALKCGEYALDHIDWTQRRAADVIQGREFLYAQLRQAGLATFASHTNFLLMRCPDMDSGRQLVAAARERRYLLKGPFAAAPLDNCVRVSIGPLALMQEFWADCQDLLRKHVAPAT